MKLSDYLAHAPRGTATKLAKTIGVDRVMLSLWTAKTKPRPVPSWHCVAIEKATAGIVTRRDLRPDDWHRIWPDLAPKRRAKVAA